LFHCLLSESADGSLTVTTSNDNFNTTLTGPGLPDNMQPQVSGSKLTMAMHPRNWDTVLELTGTFNGSRIDGSVHNTDESNCNFTMVRQ
jgi:hypothetical protein